MRALLSSSLVDKRGYPPKPCRIDKYLANLLPPMIIVSYRLAVEIRARRPRQNLLIRVAASFALIIASILATMSLGSIVKLSASMFRRMSNPSLREMLIDVIDVSVRKVHKTQIVFSDAH